HPLVITNDTTGVRTGTIIRIYRTVGADQLQGIDFTAGTVVANTSIQLAYMTQIVSANPGAGSYAIVPFNPIFYPRDRIISNITQAAQAVVTTTVTHGFI